MHSSELPREIVERIQHRRGKRHIFSSIEPARSALVVIDMQHNFVAPGGASAVPAAREIGPNITRLAGAVRAAGGAVAWVQATYTRGGPGYWPLFFDYMVSPETSARVLAGLTEGTPGHALWPELEVHPNDLRVKKNRYSAFFPGASELPQTLQQRGVDTVLITGTMTNVCCEASARDAMAAGFKTIMVGDANATHSQSEHLATLSTIAQFIGDVRSTDEVIQLLR